MKTKQGKYRIATIRQSPNPNYPHLSDSFNETKELISELKKSVNTNYEKELQERINEYKKATV